MSNYTLSTDFTAKDSLISGNPAKLVKGSEISTEFNAVATAIASKVDKTSATGSAQIPAGTQAQRDGSPAAGYVRFNSSSGAFEGFDGTQWGPLGSNNGPVADVLTYTATAAQTVFTLSMAYTPGQRQVEVFVNGLLMSLTTDYVETDYQTITFNSGLTVGDEVVFRVWRVDTLVDGDAANMSYSPAGGAAVTTTVQAKLRESVSVKDFGAVGDGVTDDAAAIEAAALAVYNAGGGIVHIPKGTYLLGTLSGDANSYYSYFTLRNGVSFVGDGQGITILKVKSGENARFSATNAPNIFATNQANSLTNSYVSDLTVDWNGANNLITGGMVARNNASILTINGATDCSFERINVKETPGNQCIYIKNEIYTTTPGRNVWVRNCEFKDCGSGLVGNTNTDHSSVYICTDDSGVLDCVYTASQTVSGACFELHGSRNYASGNLSNYYSRGFWLASDYQSITDVQVTDCIHNNVNEAFAISAQTYAVNNVSVKNCTFRQKTGLTYGSVSYFVGGNTVISCDRWEISGCHFIGNNYANNRFLQHQRQAEFIFSGNTVENFNDGTNGYGLFFSGVAITGVVIARRVRISNNIFKDVLLPIYCSQGASTIDIIDVVGNTAYSSSSAGVWCTFTLLTATGLLSGNTYNSNHSAASLSGGVVDTTYTTGTYTPTIYGGTTVGTGTYSTQVGRYILQGKLCTVTINLTWSAHTGSGQARVSLPFTAATNSVNMFSSTSFSNYTLTAGTTQLTPYVGSGLSYALLLEQQNGAAATNASLDTAANVGMTLIYEIA